MKTKTKIRIAGTILTIIVVILMKFVLLPVATNPYLMFMVCVVSLPILFGASFMAFNGEIPFKDESKSDKR